MRAVITGLIAVVALTCLVGCGRSDARQSKDIARGAKLIASLGCGGCHRIPHIPGAYGKVGPPLTGIADRSILAGVLANTPDNMTMLVTSSQSVVPGNAMPNMEMDDHDAHDVVAYLYTLH